MVRISKSGIISFSKNIFISYILYSFNVYIIFNKFEKSVHIQIFKGSFLYHNSLFQICTYVYLKGNTRSRPKGSMAKGHANAKGKGSFFK